jgi:hypothetical protein
MGKAHSTGACLHPLCEDVKFEDEQSFYYHLNDVHGFRRANKVPQKRKREGVDTKQQEGDSRHHAVHSPKKPKWEGDIAGCSSLVDLSGNLDSKDALDITHPNESLDDFISQCIELPPSPSPSVNGDEAHLDDPAAMTECKIVTGGNATDELLVDSTPALPPSPGPSVDSDRTHLDTTTMTQCKEITDANADKPSSNIVGTDSHADTPKIRIKLSYKRSKIILRMGQAPNRQQQLEKHCGRRSKGHGKD